MLKRKIKVTKEETVDKKSSLSIKRATNESKTPLPEKLNSAQFPKDFISWIEQNLLKDLSNIRDYEFLKVYAQNEWGESLSKEEFIQNLLKAFFTKEDLEKFKSNIQELLEKDEINKELKEQLDSIKSQIKSLKEQNQRLKKETISKTQVVELILNSFEGQIKELLIEESKEADTGEFIVAFSSSFRDILVVLELSKDKEEDERLEIVYEYSKRVLKSISGVYIASRKRLLSLLAEYLSSWFESYKFISGEDYSFVDSKVHNIVVKEGQKIKEALSFCVIKSDSLQTIKYADVVTF